MRTLSSEDSQGDASVVDGQGSGELSAAQRQTMASTVSGISALQPKSQLTAASA